MGVVVVEAAVDSDLEAGQSGRRRVGGARLVRMAKKPLMALSQDAEVEREVEGPGQTARWDTYGRRRLSRMTWTY